MSSSNEAYRPLNDDQADAVTKKMCAFIEQEAMEKAKEIKTKADEDYNIEKARIVRKGTEAIDEQIRKKMQQDSIKRKIEASSYTNSARLKVLRRQDELMNELVESSRQKLLEIVNDKTKYRKLMLDLIVQAAVDLLEERVVVVCLPSDLELASSVIKEAQEIIKSITGLNCLIEIDKKSRLETSDIGGVVVTTFGGKIKALNTLSARLEVTREKILPDLRVLLYGHPPSRKFFD